jgi:uncharacterized protein YndB with AHSA1/START domain
MDTTAAPIGRTIAKEIFIKSSAERVFRALVDKDDLERWFVTHAVVDARPGGALHFTWNQDETVSGEFRVIEPPRHLVYLWDEGPNLGTTEVTFTLTPQDDGTLLPMTHRGFGSGGDWDRLYDGVNSGWVTQFGFLRAWLEEGTPKTWRKE